jgi:hypothetical protein
VNFSGSYMFSSAIMIILYSYHNLMFVLCSCIVSEIKNTMIFQHFSSMPRLSIFPESQFDSALCLYSLWQ